MRLTGDSLRQHCLKEQNKALYVRCSRVRKELEGWGTHLFITPSAPKDQIQRNLHIQMKQQQELGFFTVYLSFTWSCKSKSTLVGKLCRVSPCCHLSLTCLLHCVSSFGSKLYQGHLWSWAWWLSLLTQALRRLVRMTMNLRAA